MNEEQKPQAWEEEFDKFVDKNYEEKFGLSSTFKLVWGCEECSGGDAESDIKDFIRTLRQKDKERLLAAVKGKAFRSPKPWQIDHKKAIEEVLFLITEIYD